MKNNFLAMAVAIGFLGASSSFADVKPASTKVNLSGVPAAELPVKAAELVKAAKSRDRAAVTTSVVKTCLSMNPSIAPTLVSVIAKTTPEMASLAAGTAAAEQPKLAVEIAKAAAAAAPKQAGKIVSAVCRAVPSQYRNIAIAAAQAAPGQDKEILTGVAAALPELKANIQAALASTNRPSVAAVLAGSSLASNGNNASASVPSVRGPTIAPPYVPLSGSTSGSSPADTAPVPSGGRDYAAP